MFDSKIWCIKLKRKAFITSFYKLTTIIAKKILKIMGNSKFQDKPKLIKNVFHTDYQKRCLLSYMTIPFSQSVPSKSHTNIMECLTAAEIFNELGYCVDVVDHNANINIDYNTYDVIYGMGQNLELSFDCHKKQKRIYYATGCNPLFSNVETLLCSRRFYEKTGLYAFQATRYISISQDKQYLLSDKCIILGNEFTKKTYTDFDDKKDRYNNLNAFFYKTCNFEVSEKNFNISRNHLLWFGSTGCLHKGLDIAIDICLKRHDLILHICGANKIEKEFWNYYEPKIENAHNIIDHGFIDLESSEFKKLMELCGFAIYPSVSEGGAVSLLTVMGNGGLIPLITESVGINLPCNIKLASTNSTDAFEKLIDEYEKMSPSELRSIAVSIQKEICDIYTHENYKETLKKHIKSALQDTDNL